MPTIEFPVQLLHDLRQARRIAILTGAGISKESGIPTFREARTGLWARYDPQELATPVAFRRNPRLVWKWYEWRRRLVSAAKPNAGHRAIARMQTVVPSVTVITQNVDGLHQEAGSINVIELHGNLRRSKCFANNHIVPLGSEMQSEDVQDPPRCPQCDSLLRPDVVWFGETLDRDTIEEAYRATQRCDVFFSVGTSALVHPAATLPYIAMEGRALTVEINPANTPLSADADHVLPYSAGVALPLLIDAAWPDDVADA